MSETKNFVPSIERIVGGGLLIVGAVEAMNRYNRLSHLLKGLCPGHDEEYLSLLTVEYNGPQTLVELTEFPHREEFVSGIIGRETSTRTMINVHWGDDGLSKPFITANQAKKKEGEIVGTGDYRCDRPFTDNSLRLGSVARVARVARGIQRRQRGY